MNGSQLRPGPVGWSSDSIVCCRISWRKSASCRRRTNGDQSAESEKELWNRQNPSRREERNQPAAIYARVSSDRQKENHTIASQTAALIEYAQTHDYSVPREWIFPEEGYSGAVLVRPGWEALRDLAAEGQIAAALIYSPDRLSRKYAYQVLLSEELSRCGVELVFLKAPGRSHTGGSASRAVPGQDC